MITVDSFAGKKVTKGLYNKVLKVAQQIILDKTEEFIATGKQTPLTKEEREITTLSDFLSLAVSSPLPAKMRRPVEYYIALSKDPTFQKH